MSLVMILSWDGVKPDQYAKLVKLGKQDPRFGKGLLFHVSAFSKYGLRVTDVWESQTDFDNFVRDILLPAAEKAGIKGQPTVELLPIQNILIPQVEKLLSDRASLAGTGA